MSDPDTPMSPTERLFATLGGTLLITILIVVVIIGGCEDRKRTQILEREHEAVMKKLRVPK